LPISALALVLLAAIIHATWNLLAKQAKTTGVAFVWACSMVSVIAYAPIALWAHGQAVGLLGPMAWMTIVASAVIHVAYFLCLRRGYERADLSVVYPVARGSGPLFASLAAILFLGESASVGGLAGLALIVLGTFTIGGGLAMLRGARSERLSQGLYWGSLTGLLIAGYTVNDGYAVRVLGVAPLLFDWLSIAVRAALLTPAAMLQRASVRQSITTAWRPMLAVGLMSPLAYILVLYAMTLAPISLVAPAREVSMLVAAFFGARLLGEGSVRRRVMGAALIAAGVVALAAGR